MLKILDQHHDSLLCSQCNKYLSVFPVKVYENNIVKCGRCIKNDDGGVVSLYYEELAKHCVFKCVNRYEGCRKLLLPHEVAEHEKTCMGKTYTCPSCPNSVMSARELIQHFKGTHKNCFLTSNYFYLTLKKKIHSERFLYVQDDNLFIIFLNCIPNDLYFSIATLWDLKNTKQQFRITAESISFDHLTTSQNCVNLTNFNQGFYFKIDASCIFNQLIKIEFILNVSDTPICCYELSTRFIENNLQEVTKQNLVKNKTSKKMLNSLEVSKKCDVPPQQINQQRLPQLTSEICREPSKSEQKSSVKLWWPKVTWIPCISRGSVELTSQFRIEYPQYELTSYGTFLYSKIDNKRIELTCSNCKELMGSKLFSCHLRKHMFCLECNTWCVVCNDYVEELSEKEREPVLSSKYLNLYCRWGCGSKHHPEDLKIHETCCKLNSLICPLCSKRIKTKDLSCHFTDSHQQQLINGTSDLEFLKYKENIVNRKYWVLISNRIFNMELTKIANPISDGLTYCELKIIPFFASEYYEVYLLIDHTAYHKIKGNGIAEIVLEGHPKLYLHCIVTYI